MNAHAHIRVATPEDAHVLPAVEQSAGEAFRALPDLAWIADDRNMSAAQHAPLIALGCVWVAEKQRRIVGFISAERIGDALHIWEMAVAHAEQGCGLGRALLKVAIEAACAQHAKRVTLTTFRDVAWNAPFYAASGFRVLDVSEMDARLRGVLDEEVAHGLPAERRCAMGLDL